MKARLCRWVKARLDEPEYAALVARASVAGQSVSSYVRRIIVAERSDFDAAEAMHALEERLRRDSGALSVALEPLVVEAVLLGREVLASRDAQALSRVRAQLDSRFPGRKPC